MKYRVENNLDLFEFHDADVSFVSFDNNELILSARHLNIHKNTDENPNDNDMEITLANVTFLKFKVLSFEPMRTYQIDDDGKWYTNEPRVIIKGKEAEIHFLENAKKGFSINCIVLWFIISSYIEFCNFSNLTNKSFCFFVFLYKIYL